MSDLAFALTVCEPKRITKTSWWLGAPREGFTREAEKVHFEPNPKRAGRGRTIAEEIVAASQIVD